MISLCMIIKNEEKYLPDCLQSVQGIVDEIIIVDTGSTDNSIKIAEEFNARIFQFTWIGDFSAARNYSLQNASGDWILYLDADERLNNNSVQELKRITAESCKKAYWCNVISLDEINKHPSVMSYARLFPNNKKVRFTGTIHEQIEPSLIENGFSIEKSLIEIIHLGYSVSEEEIKKKAERNLELLLNEFQASGSGYYAFQLGQTLGILKR
ncbi:MAG: glycosyltransferase family 2 protein, partial [Ignavibacteriaceae bacterium]